MKGTVISRVAGALGTVPKVLEKGQEELEIKRQIETIGQNSEKSPGSLRILSVPQTPMKDHQLTLLGKNLKDNNNNNNNIHELVDKVIHRELYKKFRFDNTNKWYIHNPASVQKSDTHKLLSNFHIHMDHLFSARRPDLVINKEKIKKFAKLSTLLSRLTAE